MDAAVNGSLACGDQFHVQTTGLFELLIGISAEDNCNIDETRRADLPAFLRISRGSEMEMAVSGQQFRH
jgi:hypothetical protein